MAPYEQSLFAVKPLIRISIYERMLTESFARFNFNRLETCASLIISEFRSQVGPVLLLSVIFDGRFGFGYFVGGPDRTGKQLIYPLSTSSKTTLTTRCASDPARASAPSALLTLPV